MGKSSGQTFWDLKPIWCQPFSIIAFGLLLITVSWIILHNIIITLIVFSLVFLWWLLFLVLVPISYKNISDK